jgi:predicted TIM-barrel fold metal-dependent hydrolase
VVEPQLKHRDAIRKPSLVVPNGACDCHAHVVGDRAKFPFTPNRSFTPHVASYDEYAAVLGTLGIERRVIVQPSFYGFDNSCTLSAVAASGLDRARGVAMIDPATDSKALRALDDQGIRGARFITAVKGGGSLDQLRDVAKRIAPLGWHLQLYIAASFQAILKLLDTGRCWVKLCGYRNSVAGHPYADVAPLARRFIAHAPERCLWGTDWPHTNVKDHVPDDGDLLDLLRDWAPDEAVRNRILVSNPAALYGFS